MTLGEALITELGRRGERGMYFDYDGYQALKLVDGVDAMQAFLDARGFESVLAAEDAAWLAAGLAEAAADRVPPIWATAEYLSVVTFPIWLLTRLKSRRRMFPRRRPGTGESTGGAGGFHGDADEKPS